MKKALLVIDVQNGLVEQKNFCNQLEKIKSLIKRFNSDDSPVIFLKQVDEDKESIFCRDSHSSEIVSDFTGDIKHLIEKTTADSFYRTNLEEELSKLSVEHLYICGFNTEFCCMFTAITAFSRGYKVTFVEDATGSVNDESTYEMPGLDIQDFVGSVLNWSNVIEDVYYEEI